MADLNHISVNVGDSLPLGTSSQEHRSIELTADELGIINFFAQGQKQSISSQNLKLEYTETSIRLSDLKAKLVGISKQVNQWQRKVLISNKSRYRSNIASVLIGSGFIVKKISSHPEFTEYHYYEIPSGYKLNYTEVIQLWKVWWNNKRYQLNIPNAPIDVLVFSKGNWQLIRDLQPKQGNFILQTAKGAIKIEAEDYVAWIDSIESKNIDTSQSEFLNQQQILTATPSTLLDSKLPSSKNMAAATVSSTLSAGSSQLKLPTAAPAGVELDRPSPFQIAYLNELPEPDEDLDLESYLSTFSTEDAEDIDRIEGIYNIDELLSDINVGEEVAPPPPPPRPTQLPSPTAAVSAESTPQKSTPIEPESTPLAASVATPQSTQPPLSSEQRQQSLKLKAMNVLATYLQDGDLITHTEVLKNAQGQEINRKITKIQRGCPSWAIEQVKKLELGSI
jgi:hypothetical protein